MARKPALKREVLTEIDLAGVVSGNWSSNPFCIVSLGQCVTTLCSKVRTACLPDTIGG